MFNIELKTLIDFSDEDVVNGVLTIPEGVEIIKYINNFSCRTSADITETEIAFFHSTCSKKRATSANEMLIMGILCLTTAKTSVNE